MANPDDRAPLGVYVHFPWCLQKCPYCDFVSFAAPRSAIDHEGYADAVVRDLAARTSPDGDLAIDPSAHRLASVFFGGGTPSLWEPHALGRVLRAILAAFPGGQDVEVTVECNPSSLDEDRARALVDQGVDRLSIGVQGLDDARLKFLGRLHGADGAREAIRAAVRAKVPRVSGDLIYAVAGESAETAAAEADELAGLGLSHVSAYALTIEPATRFGDLARKGRLPLADDGAMVDSFFAVEAALARHGLAHYEVSNFAREGHESRHNLGYWRGDDYLGLGCAAYGAIATRSGHHVRYRNAPDPGDFVESTLGPRRSLVGSVERLDADTRLRERIMLGLRLARGFDLAAAARAVGAAAWTADRERATDKLVSRGRLVREGDVLRVPRDAWIWADDTAAELF